MEKTASIIILHRFLKERNKLGTFLFYLNEEKGNRKVLEQYSKLVEISASENDRKDNFENIIGYMTSRTSSLGKDYLFYIYMDWKEYLKKNWNNINKTYLELKQKLQDGENIQNVESRR